MAAMEAFLDEHGRVVIKPLDGMGGRSIFVIAQGDPNTRVVLETLTEGGRRYAMAQRYLPEIAETGDARILLVDGEPVPHALARMPAAGDHRGNLAAGARAESRALTDRDRWLASRIGPGRCASAACCSSGSTSSAASSPRSTSRARPASASSRRCTGTTSAAS